jgi:hypothetical protein
MSFTEDELQAFSSILEQRFVAHRQEMERALDQRLDSFRQNIDHRLATFQQELPELLGQQLASNVSQPGASIDEKLDEQRDHIARLFSREAEQKTHQVEATVDRMLAAQLSGIEQLLGQHLARRQSEASVTEIHPQLDTIEVQTELSWEDLVAVMGKALDERLASLSDSLQLSVKNLEQYLSVYLRGLRDELTHVQSSRPAYANSVINNSTSVQEMLAGIEHLERIMESMQVAMTANHALLSNRLYHHQQLPLERAHPTPGGQTRLAPANGVGSLLTQAKERLASGLVPETPASPDENDEPTGH